MTGAPGRALVLLLGAWLVLAVLPARAEPSRPRTGGESEARAVALLEQAAEAAAERPWSGTQYVASWRGRTQTAAVLDVVHVPGRGSTVTPADTPRDGDEPGTATPELDPELLRLLADSYELEVAPGPVRSAGRSAVLVEALRDSGDVAGRFWLDRASGLVLRREVYGTEGERLRSSAFVDLEIGAAVRPAPLGVRVPSVEPAGTKVDPDDAARDWVPPRALPGRLALYDARVTHQGVLHLAYSDGLSTLSVFAQDGALDDEPRAGFTVERVAGSRVWSSPGDAERLVWEGDGRVFTLVSDADPDTVRAAVRALPHDAAPDGLLASLVRGLSRLGSWLNPFS